MNAKIINKSPVLNLGFIGGSSQSAIGLTHKIASQMDGRWKLVAGCFSQNKRCNQETGESWGVEKNRIYASASDLLKSEKGVLDAVVILTPTPLHHPLVIQTLSAGYAVICEKSLAVSSKEVADIRAEQAKYKAFLAVTFNYSAYPMIRELKERILDNELGKIKKIKIEMPQEGYIRVDSKGNKMNPQGWRLEDHFVPTVSLDLGVHLHHLVDFLTGEKPIKVIGKQLSLGSFSGVIDDVSCLAEYSGGISCDMWFGKSALGQRNGLSVQIYGDKASAFWHQQLPEELTINQKDGVRRIVDRGEDGHIMNKERYNRFKSGHPAGFIEAFANLYTDLADSLITFKETGYPESNFIFSAEKAEAGLKYFEAVSQSNQSQQWESCE